MMPILSQWDRSVLLSLHSTSERGDRQTQQEIVGRGHNTATTNPDGFRIWSSAAGGGISRGSSPLFFGVSGRNRSFVRQEKQNICV